MDILVAEKNGINTLTSKTGSGYADTDLIQLYANDGTPNGKIARSALMSCVKDSLGTLLNQGAADLGTSLAKIPALNSGGTLGSATVANLASVLGGLSTYAPSASLTQSEMDNAAVGAYMVGTSDSPNGVGAGLLFMFRRNDTYSQVYLVTGGTQSTILTRERSGHTGTWTGWRNISFDVPTFYKNYDNLALLAQGVGGVVFTDVNSLNGDLNNAKPMVLYSLMGTYISSLANKPFSDSQNIIYIGNESRGIQISCAYDGSKISVRCKWDIWRNWVSIL